MAILSFGDIFMHAFIAVLSNFDNCTFVLGAATKFLATPQPTYLYPFPQAAKMLKTLCKYFVFLLL